jgi:hypothetical protein
MMGESYYEQDFGNPPSGMSDPRFYFRWSMWEWLLSGGSSNYGGRYGVIHPYSQTKDPTLKWVGSGGGDFTGYPLVGLDTIKYIWPYFHSRGIDLSLFQSNNALVTAWSLRAGDIWYPYLMQRGNKEFLVYDPNAYSEGFYAGIDPNQTASMTIDLSNAPGMFQVEWYRPDQGVAQSGGTIQGGSALVFTAPWAGCDVVLRLMSTGP